MSEILVHRCTPRQTKKFVHRCLMAGLVPFVQSSPGMGKSSIMRAIAQEEGLKLIDHRMSTSAPEDLSGLPRFNEAGNAEFAQFQDLFPIEGMDIPEGFNGWMLFLDEWNSASKSVQAASYKLILDKMVGQKNLHQNVVLCAAGNLATDRAIVNSLSTAMQSRVVHIEMIIDFNEWLYDVALPNKYDKRIIAYLSQFNSKLMDFRPDHTEKTFCCPRTWEFMNKLLADDYPVNQEDVALYAGTITSGVATDFVQFTRVFDTIVTYDQVMRDPEGCRIPDDISSRWACITGLMERVDEDNFGDLSTYINRFSLDFKVLFFRATMVNHPGLRSHPDFAKAARALTQYLKG